MGELARKRLRRKQSNPFVARGTMPVPESIAKGTVLLSYGDIGFVPTGYLFLVEDVPQSCPKYRYLMFGRLPAPANAKLSAYTWDITGRIYYYVDDTPTIKIDADGNIIWNVSDTSVSIGGSALHWWAFNDLPADYAATGMENVRRSDEAMNISVDKIGFNPSFVCAWDDSFVASGDPGNYTPFILVDKNKGINGDISFNSNNSNCYVQPHQNLCNIGSGGITLKGTYSICPWYANDHIYVNWIAVK